jgi:hypothetical protein
VTSKRLFFVLCAVLVLLTAGSIAGMVVGDKKLQQKSDRLVALKTESMALQAQQQSLIQAKKDVQKYSELEKIAKTIVPQDKDQARTVREIVKIADSTRIKISNISFPSSTLGQVGAKAPTSGGATQVKPVVGISGVYEMEITIQSDTNVPVAYPNLLSFLQKLEQNRRTAHVISLTVNPSTIDRNKVTFGLVLDVYIKP